MRATRIGGSLATALAASFAAVPASALFPVPQGPDFQVSSYPAAASSCSVAKDSAGNFVVVWQSYGSYGTDTLGTSIQGRRYTSSGVDLGPQFQVNTYTTYFQINPAVASDPAGGFVVVWQNPVSPTPRIQGQRYASDGLPLGSEFQVNTYTSGTERYPAVGRAANGDFVVVWESTGSLGTDTSSISIQGQRYASSGAALGSQFQINTYTTSFQEQPSVAVDPAGDFVVVWQSSGSWGTDTSGQSIHGQRYASNGSPLGSEFQVNNFTLNDQRHPSVATSGSGGFVVAWQSMGSFASDSSSYSIQAQRYASNGAALGSQFQVNSYTSSRQIRARVAADLAGDFLVTWESDGSSGSDSSQYSIQGQRYASNGTASGGEFQLDTYTTGRQTLPCVASGAAGDALIAWLDTMIHARRLDGIALGSQFQANSYTTSYQIQSAVASDAAGDFVMVWESLGSGGSDHNGTSIQGQRYDSQGHAVGSQFQVNSYTPYYQTLPSVSASPSGDFVVVWETPQIEAQRYASNGSALGGEFQVNSYTTGYSNSPDVASEPDGGFVVVWQSRGSPGTDSSDFSIQGQRYASNGSAAGSQFQVNTVTTYGQTAPSVATDPSGNFVVVWQSNRDGFVDTNIEGQRFASNGTRQGSEFQVNSYTTSSQKYPNVAKAANGDFVVVWQSRGCFCGDSSYESILGQRYASDGSTLGNEFEVNTYTTGLQTLPSVAQEADGSFLVTWQSEGSFANSDLTLTAEAQRFASDGSAVGGEFQVNSYKFPPQRSPSVSVDAGGHYVVAWEARGSTDTDSSSYSIQGQRYLPEPESTLGMAAGAVLLLALRRARR